MKKLTFLLLISLSFLSYVFPQEVGSLIDARDGQKYFFVKIYDQWWLKENMNIGSFILSDQESADNEQFEKYCYNNKPSNCEIYGGMYQWYEMMDYNLPDDGDIGTTQGICPSGWHIPTEKEWEVLIKSFGDTSVAGGALKEPGYEHWDYPNDGATNESGFTALPAGRSLYEEDFDKLGWYSCIYSSTESEYNTALAYFYRLNSPTTDISHPQYDKRDSRSARCIKNPDHKVYLTFLNKTLKLYSRLEFDPDHTLDTIILVNSGDIESIEISSITTGSSAFTLSHDSFGLDPGDSVAVAIQFNPEIISYIDTLFIRSNDPNDSLVMIPISVEYPIQASITDSTNITCAGFSDGTATVTPFLGYPPYQYLWDDPANSTDSTVTGLEANKYYHVTVSDSDGGSVTDSIMLSEPESISIQSEYPDSICLHSITGYINIIPSGGTLPYSYLWSNEQTSQNLEDLAPGEYVVTLTDGHGCQKSDTIMIEVLAPFGNEEICLVTVDPVTGWNMIIWERTAEEGISSYLVYRETTIINVYDSIGVVQFDAPGSFMDTLSDPKEKSSKYSITVVDTCGSESLLSPPHSTMHLTLNKGLGGTNLVWSKYEGFEVQTYNIWRGTNTSEMAIIGSVSGSNFTYTDQYPLAGTNNYQVEVVSPNSCDPDNLKSVYSSSLSNVAEIFLDGQEDHFSSGLNIFPNPANSKITISFPNPGQEPYQIILLDTYGRMLKNQTYTMVNQFTLDCSDLRSGLYFIELRGPKIYRGKIIIE